MLSVLKGLLVENRWQVVHGVQVHITNLLAVLIRFRWTCENFNAIADCKKLNEMNNKRNVVI